jgi:arginyl-tRNA synthetase
MMPFNEQKELLKKIDQFCLEQNLPVGKIEFRDIPFSGEWGIAAPLFPLAAADPNRVGPVPQHAQILAEKLKEYLGHPAGFSRVEALKGYLNLYYETSQYASKVIDYVHYADHCYGMAEPTGKTVMVEYSNPNTHKPLHVGHLRNVILGSSICNILEASGDKVIRANYIGDIGLHVIKWMCNYEMYHAGQAPSADIMRWMADLYTEADRRFHDDPGFEEACRAYFSRWDEGDKDIEALWLKTRQWSMDGFKQVYELLGAKFDRVYFESDVEESGKVLVEDLLARGLAEDGRPENPVIIDLDKILGTKEEYRVAVILRSDSTSLYATKELPLAIMKFEEYPLDQSIYVIDVRQSLHMKQMRKVLELMGYDWAKHIYHLAYEIVNLPGNVTMSSRDGTVVLLDDLIREATDRALSIVKEKNPDLSPESQHEIAEMVAIGAIKYPMISRENTKIVTFDWESALDFNGQSAPYIQYACVRANSILRRAGLSTEYGQMPSASFAYDLDAAEVNLIELIARLPIELSKAAKEYKPSQIATYAYDLAKAFNDFYNQCPVLNAEDEIRSARLALTNAARITIENALHLLGINAPQVM